MENKHKSGMLYPDLSRLKVPVYRQPLDRHYIVEDNLYGSGFYTLVKKCHHKYSGETYAAKIINLRRPGIDVNFTRTEAFHEIAVLERCKDCPRILKLHEVYDYDMEIILVMDFANGGDFQSILDDDIVPDEETVGKFMQQLLQGILFLHRQNIAHLDIKPQNVVLMGTFPDCEVKLCDFENSRLLGPDKEIREIVGTPDYIAPEIIHYDKITLATDMWAIGILTYVLLTGFSPFGGETIQETFLNISQVRLDFPEDMFQDVSLEAQDFIASLLKGNPKERLTARQCVEHPWLKHKAWSGQSSLRSSQSLGMSCHSLRTISGSDNKIAKVTAKREDNPRVLDRIKFFEPKIEDESIKCHVEIQSPKDLTLSDYFSGDLQMCSPNNYEVIDVEVTHDHPHPLNEDETIDEVLLLVEVINDVNQKGSEVNIQPLEPPTFPKPTQSTKKKGLQKYMSSDKLNSITPVNPRVLKRGESIASIREKRLCLYKFNPDRQPRIPEFRKQNKKKSMSGRPQSMSTRDISEAEISGRKSPNINNKAPNKRGTSPMKVPPSPVLSRSKERIKKKTDDVPLRKTSASEPNNNEVHSLSRSSLRQSRRRKPVTDDSKNDKSAEEKDIALVVSERSCKTKTSFENLLETPILNIEPVGDAETKVEGNGETPLNSCNEEHTSLTLNATENTLNIIDSNVLTVEESHTQTQESACGNKNQTSCESVLNGSMKLLDETETQKASASDMPCDNESEEATSVNTKTLSLVCYEEKAKVIPRAQEGCDALVAKETSKPLSTHASIECNLESETRKLANEESKEEEEVSKDVNTIVKEFEVKLKQNDNKIAFKTETEKSMPCKPLKSPTQKTSFTEFKMERRGSLPMRSKSSKYSEQESKSSSNSLTSVKDQISAKDMIGNIRSSRETIREDKVTRSDEKLCTNVISQSEIIFQKCKVSMEQSDEIQKDTDHPVQERDLLPDRNSVSPASSKHDTRSQQSSDESLANQKKTSSESSVGLQHSSFRSESPHSICGSFGESQKSSCDSSSETRSMSRPWRQLSTESEPEYHRSVSESPSGSQVSVSEFLNSRQNAEVPSLLQISSNSSSKDSLLDNDASLRPRVLTRKLSPGGIPCYVPSDIIPGVDYDNKGGVVSENKQCDSAVVCIGKAQPIVAGKDQISRDAPKIVVSEELLSDPNDSNDKIRRHEIKIEITPTPGTKIEITQSPDPLMTQKISTGSTGEQINIVLVTPASDLDQDTTNWNLSPSITVKPILDTDTEYRSRSTGEDKNLDTLPRIEKGKNLLGANMEAAPRRASMPIIETLTERVELENDSKSDTCDPPESSSSIDCKPNFLITRTRSQSVAGVIYYPWTKVCKGSYARAFERFNKKSSRLKRDRNGSKSESDETISENIETKDDTDQPEAI